MNTSYFDSDFLDRTLEVFNLNNENLMIDFKLVNKITNSITFFYIQIIICSFIFSQTSIIKKLSTKLLKTLNQSLFKLNLNEISFSTYKDQKNKLNKSKVKKAAEIANIKIFIEENLGGFNKFVGEKGIKLSGGQIQRIGIARALYKKSQLLVLDEATSSLDSSTEQKVINALSKLEHKPTIIMIAHRINTLTNCDRIIELENGKIIREGLPKDILNFSKIKD